MTIQIQKVMFLVLAFGSMVTVLPNLGRGQDGPPQVLTMTPKTAIDENLFLIRNIEHTLQTWRGPRTAPEDLQIWLAATRTSLSQLRKTAEFDKLDSRVVSAYGDLISLLDDYEEFLARADLVTFISDVHRAQNTPPNSRKLILDGASAGGQVGAIAGSFLGPGGTALGGTGGAALGAISGIRDALRDCRDHARVNSKIDQATKDYIAKRTVELESRFASAYKTQQLVAHRLAAEKKWGKSAGFEQTDLSLDEQRKQRPNDPFLLVQIAVQGKGDPHDRAMLCYDASRLVPQDRVPDVDVYDTFRASFLLIGAEIASQGAFNPEGKYDTKLARGAIRFHKTATSFVNSPLPIFAYETFANSNAFAGNLEDAAREYAELLHAGYSGRVFLYNYACTCSRKGEVDRSLELLTKSFGSVPRWDPDVLADPDLKDLLKAHRAEVETLCKPAIVGKWKNKSLNRHTIEFRIDGTSTEVSLLRTVDGTFVFSGLDRVRIKQQGMMWGTNEAELQFKVVGDEMHLTVFTGGKKVLTAPFIRF